MGTIADGCREGLWWCGLCAQLLDGSLRWLDFSTVNPWTFSNPQQTVMCLCKGTCSVNVRNINFSWKRLLCWDRVPSLLFLRCPWCHHWGLTLWLHQVLIVSLRPQLQVLLSYGSEGYDSNAKAVGEHIQIIENFKILPWTQTIRAKSSYDRGSRHTQREHAVPAQTTSDGDKQGS